MQQLISSELAYIQSDIPLNDSSFRLLYIFERFNIEKGKKLLIEIGAEDGKRFFPFP